MMADPRAEMIQAATNFYSRGWMVGTAGNLSARANDESFWITVSGRDKGTLEPTDFIRVDTSGNAVEQFNPGDRPSAETSIHAAIYKLFPQANACFHVHSVPANVVSTFSNGTALNLPALEMIKGLDIWEENPTVALPLFENLLDVPSVARSVEERFANQLPKVPALLIKHHGVTTWAPSVREARNRVEILEFIFNYMVEMRRIQG